MTEPIASQQTTAAQTGPTQATTPHPPTVDNPAVDIDNPALLGAVRSAVSVGRKPSTTGDLFDNNIVAKPLSMGTGFFNLRPKSPNVTFRGITMSVMTKEGPSFLRYEQARSQGFVNATLADVDPRTPVPPSFIKDNGQRIVNGDLIMMKIDSMDYRGALKNNAVQAMNATRRVGAVEQTNKEIRQAMQESNIPSKLGRKLSPFTPGKEDFGE